MKILMIQGPFSINFGNPLLEDIQDMVQAFLCKDEHGQTIPQFDLASEESTDLTEENVSVSRDLSNQNHLQSNEKPVWQHIQEKRNKIAVWKSRFHEVKEACHQRGISPNASRKNASEVKLADILDTGTTDFKLDDLDDELSSVEARNFSENSFNEMRDNIQIASDEFQAIMQAQRSISERTTRALLNLEQQRQEWGLLSEEVIHLNQEAQNFQSPTQQIDVLERDVTFHREQLEDLRDMHELEDQLVVVEDGLSRVESQQHEEKKQLLKMDILEGIRRDEETARADLNHVSKHLVLDSLKNKFIEVTSNVESAAKEVIYGTASIFQGTRDSISTFQKHVRKLPPLIRDAIKESIRKVSAFIWENFTNLGWNTIEVISSIGKTILQYVQDSYDYIVRNITIVFDRINLSFAGLSILPGCAYVMTGAPFAFGAVAVTGYLFIRRK